MTLITPTHAQCRGHGRLCLINVSVPVQELRSTSIGSDVLGGAFCSSHGNDAAFSAVCQQGQMKQLGDREAFRVSVIDALRNRR